VFIVLIVDLSSDSSALRLLIFVCSFPVPVNSTVMVMATAIPMIISVSEKGKPVSRLDIAIIDVQKNQMLTIDTTL
jgi:hypothetical protein